MKHAKIVQVLISCLLVVSVSAGCKGPPPPKAGILIKTLADDAAQAADDILRARQAARVVKNAGELSPLLDDMDDAARQAQRAAEQAKAAGQQINNLPSESQILANLSRARRSAEIARVSRTSINEVVNNPELFAAWKGVDDVSGHIVGQSIRIEPGPEEEAIRQALQDVVAGSFCDALVETLNNGQFPGQQDVIDSLAENLQKAVVSLTGLDEISSAILSKVGEVVYGQPPDALEQYKEYCGKVFGG